MSSPNEDKPQGKETRAEKPTANAPSRCRIEKSNILFIERLYRKIGLKPYWTGLLISLALIAIVTVLEIATGRMGVIIEVLTSRDETYLQTTGPDPFGFVYLIVHLLLVGYAPTAVVLITTGAKRYAKGLATLIEPSEQAMARLKELGTYPGNGAHLVGIGVAAIAALVPLLDTSVWIEREFFPYNPADMTPEIMAQRVFAITFGYFVGQLQYCAMLEAWRYNRLARDVQISLLLERRTLTPFTRVGLNNVMTVLIFPAILFLFLFNSSLAPIILGICAIAFAFSAAGLVSPLLGIHERVAGAKRQQLDWVNAELATERTSVVGGSGERFVTLMAYRNYIESVREWPLDGTTLGRLALYLMIPLASWVGGALVERVVDAALG